MNALATFSARAAYAGRVCDLDPPCEMIYAADLAPLARSENKAVRKSVTPEANGDLQAAFKAPRRLDVLAVRYGIETTRDFTIGQIAGLTGYPVAYANRVMGELVAQGMARARLGRAGAIYRLFAAPEDHSHVSGPAARNAMWRELEARPVPVFNLMRSPKITGTAYERFQVLADLHKTSRARLFYATTGLRLVRRL